MLIPASVVVVVCKCVRTRANKYLILMFLLLAAGSREMMGLSVTIFASSYRTFTFFMFALICCSVILFREIKSSKLCDQK